MTLTDAALAAELAVDAGKLLLAVRDQVGFAQPWHLGDTGDGRANQLIIRRLRDERPGDAVLSEESPDTLARLHSDRVWIVDPLDGTREFTTPGRDDWAVHIALWQRRGADGFGTITDAAVSLPAYANRSNVVFRTDTVTPPVMSTEVPQPIR
uniref:inositol monophosphatase family protein n=1 Tax=Mycolicibacter arupensis TaxID=342002 RepID=UPI003B3AA763